jgi:phosphate transport system substrate-binding protein
MSFVKATVAAIAVAAVSATSAAARDQVHIAGSSTVLPYASIVAEAFGENFDFPTPIVEGGGSGAGRKRMCEGVGPKYNRYRELIIIDEGRAMDNL